MNFLVKKLRALLLLVVRMNALICDLRSIKDNSTAISISVVSTNSERFSLLLPCKDGLIHVVWIYSLYTLKPSNVLSLLCHKTSLYLKIQYMIFSKPQTWTRCNGLRFTMLLIIAGENHLSKKQFAATCLQQLVFRWSVFFCYCV